MPFSSFFKQAPEANYSPAISHENIEIEIEQQDVDIEEDHISQENDQLQRPGKPHYGVLSPDNIKMKFDESHGSHSIPRGR